MAIKASDGREEEVWAELNLPSHGPISRLLNEAERPFYFGNLVSPEGKDKNIYYKFISLRILEATLVVSLTKWLTERNKCSYWNACEQRIIYRMLGK